MRQGETFPFLSFEPVDDQTRGTATSKAAAPALLSLTGRKQAGAAAPCIGIELETIGRSESLLLYLKRSRAKRDPAQRCTKTGAIMPAAANSGRPIDESITRAAAISSSGQYSRPGRTVAPIRPAQPFPICGRACNALAKSQVKAGEKTARRIGPNFDFRRRGNIKSHPGRETP